MLRDAAGKTRIACIGECMVEFRQAGDNLYAAGFGGDTLNTAVYLARLGLGVDYVTALGDDPHSTAMLAAWNAEGVGTDEVLRVPGGRPGLYVIDTNDLGERRFSYWRDQAAARRLFDLPGTEPLRQRLAAYRLLYLSGISLSLYGEGGRETLMETLLAAREAGTSIAFDTNYRPLGWEDTSRARYWFTRALEVSDVVFASTEDLLLLFGEAYRERFASAAHRAERVLKHADLRVTVEVEGHVEVVSGRPAERVVDTTAAGDSFAAAYLAARLSGRSTAEAARAGHDLARRVVGFPGALMPPGEPLQDAR